jgi:hypothetical protein
MTDDHNDQIGEILITACEFGHVHFAFGFEDDSALVTVLTVGEACALARTLLRAAFEADMALKKPSTSGGGVGSCSLH